MNDWGVLFSALSTDGNVSSVSSFARSHWLCARLHNWQRQLPACNLLSVCGLFVFVARSCKVCSASALAAVHASVFVRQARWHFVSPRFTLICCLLIYVSHARIRAGNLLAAGRFLLPPPLLLDERQTR